MPDAQTQVREILDEQLAPLLNSIPETGFTLFDSVGRMENGHLSEVVVWVRSFDILNHAEAIAKRLPIDPVVREGAGVNGEPRQNEDTVLIRFVKELDSNVELLIEFFQVYGDEEEAKEALESLNAISN